VQWLLALGDVPVMQMDSPGNTGRLMPCPGADQTVISGVVDLAAARCRHRALDFFLWHGAQFLPLRRLILADAEFRQCGRLVRPHSGGALATNTRLSAALRHLLFAEPLATGPFGTHADVTHLTLQLMVVGLPCIHFQGF
jgi:hypothetical protein